MKQSLSGKILSKIPYLRYAYFYRQNCNHRPGHFYSPVVNLDELESRQNKIWASDRKLPGIDLNEDKQQDFLEPLTAGAYQIPFPENPDGSGFRYYFDNKTYAHADGLVLFSILMSYRPK